MSPIMQNKSVKRLNFKAHSIALGAFFKICEAWGLQENEKRTLLGSPSRTTYFSWKRGDNAKLSHDTLERISYILGIYKALQILLPEPNIADNWIKKNNNASMFNGASALSKMLSGNVADLYIVRQYLDAERSGWA